MVWHFFCSLYAVALKLPLLEASALQKCKSFFKEATCAALAHNCQSTRDQNCDLKSMSVSEREREALSTAASQQKWHSAATHHKSVLALSRSLVLFVISSLLTLSENAIEADFYYILSAWIQKKTAVLHSMSLQWHEGQDRAFQRTTFRVIYRGQNALDHLKAVNLSEQ